jgi:hypothetical protein
MRTAANKEGKASAAITARMITDGKRERERLAMKKRTRITVVTRQTVVARQLRVRCQQCGAEVPIVSPENAAGVLQTTPQEIHGLLASGELHSVEEPSGESLICGNFLANTLESEPEAKAPGSRQSSGPLALPAVPSPIKGERQ